MPRLLSPEEITAACAHAPEWKSTDGALARTFVFNGFMAAMDFVNRVAAIAEEDHHHPDIDIRWNKVHLRLSTHSAGGVTEKDVALAGRIDSIKG